MFEYAFVLPCGTAMIKLDEKDIPALEAVFSVKNDD